ncbi:HD-GYP domain-containing protein [Bacillus daqingensis]|uniref:HD-GYP domain-containing protein n=1 Tax=Bacillus daqingensis TaxID=872396 RepID=A0ABV9NV68_9BACI
MHVYVEDLVPGCILQQDVMKLTAKPLVPKKTVLQEEHLHILKTFLVESVHTEAKLVDGTAFQPERQLQEKQKKRGPAKVSLLDDNDSFTNRYLRTVQLFKKEFQKWQGRLPIEPYTMRQLFLPLYEKEPTNRELLELYHFSDKTNYIYYHAVAVGVYSAMLGRWLGYEKADVIQVGLAGMLADCGMSRLSYDPFQKKGSLNKDEFDELKKHPVLSYRMLEKVPGFNKKAMLGVLQHHERLDGSGYPLGVSKTKIHAFARINAIADTFHAMTAERLYRAKMSPYHVLEQLAAGEFPGLDPAMTACFTGQLAVLTVGQSVQLNNESSAEVLYVRPENPLRPVVRLESGQELDLASHANLYIVEASASSEAAASS